MKMLVVCCALRFAPNIRLDKRPSYKHSLYLVAAHYQSFSQRAHIHKPINVSPPSPQPSVQPYHCLSFHDDWQHDHNEQKPYSKSCNKKGSSVDLNLLRTLWQRLEIQFQSDLGNRR